MERGCNRARQSVVRKRGRRGRGEISSTILCDNLINCTYVYINHAGFPIQKLQSRVLHLHVFDYDRFSRDDSIGEMFLPLCQVIWRDVPARNLRGSIITRGRRELRDSRAGPDGGGIHGGYVGNLTCRTSRRFAPYVCSDRLPRGPSVA